MGEKARRASGQVMLCCGPQLLKQDWFSLQELWPSSTSRSWLLALCAFSPISPQHGLKILSVHKENLRNKVKLVSQTFWGQKLADLRTLAPWLQENLTKATTEACAAQRVSAHQPYHSPLATALLPFASYPGNLARFCLKKGIFGTVIVQIISMVIIRILNYSRF